MIIIGKEDFKVERLLVKEGEEVAMELSIRLLQKINVDNRRGREFHIIMSGKEMDDFFNVGGLKANPELFVPVDIENSSSGELIAEEMCLNNSFMGLNGIKIIISQL